jgi:hypothetical protein
MEGLLVALFVCIVIAPHVIKGDKNISCSFNTMRYPTDFLEEPNTVISDALGLVVVKRFQFGLHHGAALSPYNDINPALVALEHVQALHVRFHQCFPDHLLPHVAFVLLLCEVRWLRRCHNFEGFAYRCHVFGVRKGLVDKFFQNSYNFKELLLVEAFSVALENIAFHAIRVAHELWKCGVTRAPTVPVPTPVSSSAAPAVAALPSATSLGHASIGGVI